MNKCRWICILLFVMLFCGYYINNNVFADSETPSVRIEDCEQLEVYVTQENYFKLSYTITPKEYTDEIKSWNSDNEEVAIVFENGVVIPVGVGTANITLETVNGLSDTIKVVVKSGYTIEEGQIVESNNATGKFPKVFHKFIPKVSGIYELVLLDYDLKNDSYGVMVYEEGEIDVSAGFINLDWNELSVQFELESGKVYYIGTRMEGSSGDSYHTFSINKAVISPSPTNVATPAPTAVPEIITVGEKKEVAASEEKGMKRYMFIPEETGIYKFYSENVGYDVYGQILDSLGKGCSNSQNLYPYFGYYRYIGNFLIEHKLIAGEVYYLESCLTDSTYYVAIEKMPVATAIDIARKDETELKYKMEEQLRLNYTPEDGRDQIVSWVSDNPDVVTVNSDGKIFGKAFGVANIIVTTESGLTDSIKVTVVDHEIVLEDEIKRSGSSWDPVYYKFVPETDGVYKTKTWRETNGSSYPISVEIYNNEFEKLHYILSNEEENIDLKAGETYYICVDSLTDDERDTTNFMIFKANEVVTIEPTVTPQPESLLGDVNGDKKVNAEDALAVLKHSAKIDILADEILEVADVDTSKLIDAKDALEILKIAAGIIVAE